MVRNSKQKEIKGKSVQESYSNCRNSTTSTVEGRKISHQDPREALNSSSRKSKEDQDNEYEEHRPQHQIEQNLAKKYSRDEQRADEEKLCNLKLGGSAEVNWDARSMKF